MSAAYALCVLCIARSLALIHPIGHLVVMEVVRAVVIFGGVLLAAWLVLRPRTFAPSIGRCVVGGLAAGGMVGPPALAIGALPEPADWGDTVAQTAVFLVLLGAILGVVLGVLLGLAFAGFASVAFRKARDGYPDGSESALIVSAAVVAAAGAASAALHTADGEIDVVAFVMLGFAAAVLLLARQWAFVALPLLALAGTGFAARMANQAKPSWDTTPEPITMRAITELASLDGVMCGRASSGRLACWGRSAGRYLGTKADAYRSPETDARLGAIRTFALADDHACAVPDGGDHRAVCWTVGATKLDAPVGPPDVVAIAAGHGFTIALTPDGAVWRWGEDPTGVSRSTAPEIIAGLAGIKQIAAGTRHAVALGADGTAYCWGATTYGECGTTKEHPPVVRFEGGPFERVAARSGLSVLHGRNGVRIEGPSFGTDRSFFGRDRALAIAFSGAEACQLREGGGVTCTRGHEAPPNGIFARNVREVVGSDDGYCAATTQGVWCWKGYSLFWTILG